MTPGSKSDQGKRYEFHCVADGVYGGPAPTDDLDHALLETASWIGSHWDIWDTVERKYVHPISCQEEEDEVRARVAAKGSAAHDESQHGRKETP